MSCSATNARIAVLGVAVGGDADDDEAVVLPLAVDALEAGHLDAARRAPGRPEVDEHDVARAAGAGSPGVPRPSAAAACGAARW
jgi:hypothetical protein